MILQINAQHEKMQVDSTVWTEIIHNSCSTAPCPPYQRRTNTILKTLSVKKQTN